MAIARLSLASTALVVVDMQEKLLPHIHEGRQVLAQVGRLIDGINALGAAVLVTEQYRKGLGETVAPIAERVAGAVCRVEKLRFSACVPQVTRELIDRGVRTVLVCGIEAHVCVLQTCLDLAAMGVVPFVVADAVGSRRPLDRDIAMQRLIQTGVVPTTAESALLELVTEAGTDRFRAVLPIVK